MKCLLVDNVFTLIFIKLIMVALPSSATEYNSQTVVVSGATVINIYTGEKTFQDIVIDNDRISSVVPSAKSVALSRGKFIDATGLYVIPGLWDIHVHLTLEPELEQQISLLFIANGVTHIRDMGGVLDDILAFRKKVKQLDLIAPQIWIAGPLIDGSPPVFSGSPKTSKPPISLPVNTPQEAKSWIDKLAKKGVNLIKTYEMLRPDVFSAVIKRAHHHHLPVVGHIPLRMTTLEALTAGLDGIEHLNKMDFDCSTQSEALRSQRIALLETSDKAESGMQVVLKVLDTLTPQALVTQGADQCAALIQAFVEKEIWHTPTLNGVVFHSLRLYEQAHWENSFRYLPPSIRTKWEKQLPDKIVAFQDSHWTHYVKWAQQKVNEMHTEGVKLLAGSDTPSGAKMPGFSLHDELQSLVSAGLSPLAALQSATLYPAQFFLSTMSLDQLRRENMLTLCY